MRCSEFIISSKLYAVKIVEMGDACWENHSENWEKTLALDLLLWRFKISQHKSCDNTYFESICENYQKPLKRHYLR